MTQEEQLIIDKLGKNHTDSIVFNNQVCIVGLYTYKGEAFCLEGGMDYPFDSLTEQEQKQIAAEISAGHYVVDPSCQG